MNKFQFLGYSSLQICKYTFELALSGLICWMKLKSPCHCWHHQLYFIEDYVFMCFGFHKKQTGIILSEVWYSMSQQVQTSTAARPLLCWEAWGTHTHLPSLNHSGLTMDTLNLLKVNSDLKNTCDTCENKEEPAGPGVGGDSMTELPLRAMMPLFQSRSFLSESLEPSISSS